MTRVHVGLDAIGAHSGGAEPMLRGVVHALSAHERIERVTLFCSPTPLRRFSLAGLPEHVEVLVRPREARAYIQRGLWFRRRLAGALREIGADVFFGFNALGDVEGMPSVLLMQQALLCAPDERARMGGVMRARLEIVRALTRSACVAADLVIVPTPWMQEPVERLGVDSSRVECVVPHTVRLEAAAVRVPRAMEEVPEDRRVLYVGHDLPYKALDTAVLAMASVRRNLPRATLFVAGEVAAGRERDGIVALGARTPSEVRALMAHATMLVHPSRVESVGFTMLEAMAEGLPVLARHVSGRAFARQVCGDAARTIDSSDPAAWARAIASCLIDPWARDAMAERGLARHQELEGAAPFERIADLVVESACSR